VNIDITVFQGIVAVVVVIIGTCFACLSVGIIRFVFDNVLRALKNRW